LLQESSRGFTVVFHGLLANHGKLGKPDHQNHCVSVIVSSLQRLVLLGTAVDSRLRYLLIHCLVDMFCLICAGSLNCAFVTVCTGSECAAAEYNGAGAAGTAW